MSAIDINTWRVLCEQTVWRSECRAARCVVRWECGISRLEIAEAAVGAVRYCYRRSQNIKQAKS